MSETKLFYNAKSIKNILKSNRDSIDKVEMIANRGFRVCRWGSCQYGLSQDLYDVLMFLSKDVERVKGLSLENFDIKMNLDFKSIKSYQYTFEEIRKNLIAGRSGKYFENYFEENPDILKMLNDAKTIDYLFIIARNMSYDLWTISGIACNIAFTNSQFSYPDRAFRTGFECYLLRCFGFIKKDSSFRNFDT